MIHWLLPEKAFLTAGLIFLAVSPWYWAGRIIGRKMGTLILSKWTSRT